MARTRTSTVRSVRAATVPITELLSYRVHRVANRLSRSAALRYRRDFSVSLGEWRTLALLGARSPQTLNRLARLAGLDKAQMSRVVSGLHERGLVQRELGAGRTSQLTLTAEGEEVYAGLIAAANERNERLLNCLTGEELEVLTRALDKIEGVARTLAEEERFESDERLESNGD